MSHLGLLPETVPVQHQAKSCGALGTPHRNINCHKCESTGKVLRWFAGVECVEQTCVKCGGKGELSFNGTML